MLCNALKFILTIIYNLLGKKEDAYCRIVVSIGFDKVKDES